MRWMLRILAAVAVLAAGMGNAQQQAPRLALVIGNAAYTTPGWQLVNPVNDARLIASRLAAPALGFQVTRLENATRAQMETAMAAFAARLRAAGGEAVGVFYYAGHAAEKDGANLLVPVDVTARTMDELQYQAPPLNFMLRDMAQAGNRVNIVVLDACRNLPLPAGTRAGAAGGLAGLDDVPTNVLLAYATRSGATAPDNPGDSNSIFSRTLAEALQSNSGETLSTLFETVQARVAAATGFQQRPEFRNQLLRAPGFRLSSASAVATAPAPDPTLSVENAELRRRLEALERAQKAGPPAPSPATAVRPVMPGAGGAPAPGTSFRECAECPDMVVIPAGSFVMGSPAGEERYSGYDGREEPQHSVSIRSFAVSKFEITFAQWDACVAGGGCGGYRPADQGWGRGNQPAINVSWDDAQSYATWINIRVGAQRYRLLSEAEWEYAARGRPNGAANDTPFPWGQTASHERANYGADSCCSGLAAGSDRWVNTSPVGSFSANAFGLFDMHGNVAEWVQDCRAPNYSNAPNDGSAVKTGACMLFVIRGGSWNSVPAMLRSANRDWSTAASRSNGIGFRLARTL